MEWIALLCSLVGVTIFAVTLALTVWRYALLCRLPRRPFTWLTLADWVLLSGPGLSLGMSMVAFGGALAGMAR